MKMTELLIDLLRLCTVYLLISLLDGAASDKPAHKPNACDICRNFVDTFKKGIGATARANFGGGDVDWEEKKLGSYKYSETRLVEVLEHACDGLDKQKESECHHFVELHEETIEHWWFKKQDSDPDFLQWLCHDHAAVCCPDNTFGPDCSPCAQCIGEATCNGGDTRQGTGACVCNSGYHGDGCGDCTDGYFTFFRNETNTICHACHVSCKLTCRNETPLGCDECKEGWSFSEERGCEDMDECSSSPCEGSTYCNNTAGSYACPTCHQACRKCFGPGDNSCSVCNDGFKMEEGRCLDIDECAQDEDVCTGPNEECINTVGSFTCKCQKGFLRKDQICIHRTVADEQNYKKAESKKKTGERVPSNTGLYLGYAGLVLAGLMVFKMENKFLGAFAVLVASSAALASIYTKEITDLLDKIMS